MICPKCLTIESEGSLRCRRCGAQLYTGLFQKVTVPPPKPEDSDARPAGSARTNRIALAVFFVAVLVLLLVMSRLQGMAP